MLKIKSVNRLETRKSKSGQIKYIFDARVELEENEVSFNFEYRNISHFDFYWNININGEHTHDCSIMTHLKRKVSLKPD